MGDVLPRRELRELPGLGKAHNRPYVVSDDFKGHQGTLLRDNGKLDENQEEGVFETTINTSGWPLGRYFITVYAVNSPNPGPYYMASRIFSFDIGMPDFTGMGMDPNVPAAKTKVIWEDKDTYACFPSLTKLEDGRLITTFYTKVRSSHIDPTGGSVTMMSEDNGKTWKETTEHFKPKNNLTSDGRLVNVGAGGWVYVSDKETERRRSENRFIMSAKPDTIAYLTSEAWFSTSHDNGKTWEKKPIAVPDDIAGMLTFSSLQTKSGVRLVCAYGPRRGKGDSGKPNSWEVYFLRSEDEGKTWQFIYHTPELNSEVLELNETTVVELPNGELLAMHRANDDANLYSSISKDLGKTWSYPKDTGIWGYPPAVTVLPDGRILCIYGYRRPPMGIRACISNDNGRTWDIKNELILRSDGLAAGVGDLGYPKIVQLPNDELFTIYYIATDGAMPHIAGTHFKIPAKTKK